ncbi:hypothetical protein GCM10007385_40620 [Tateyamaria omphalii]|uniref:AMP-binding protein n=1 Tax=Tateyamaria omphalii TaxID=299262 RepID=UPI001678F372|nr:AMP-binding protein [Tateyamaria omphalii]GGX67379.1 hypothetical protein GCM10007385_40620 [Tateyamaria omphalii]
MAVDPAPIVEADEGLLRQSVHNCAVASRADTLTARLACYAAEMPDVLAYRFLSPDAPDTVLTYGGLYAKAADLAHRLRDAGALPGQPVALVIEPSLDFVVAFFACLMGGHPAVPLPRPRTDAARERLAQALSHVTPAITLTTETTEPALGDLASGKRLLVDRFSDPAKTDPLPEHQQDIALLQFTSGSTGTPKAVAVTHANLAAMRDTLDVTLPQGQPFTTLSWLPLEHDMGLIGGMLQTFWSGNLVLLMAPEAFMARPARWLRAISDNRVDVTVATNSAYQRAVDLTPEKARSDLDLSCLKVAFSGAEPLRAETVDSFCSAFAPYGFRRTAFAPCYGLAEATLLVAGEAPGSAPHLLPAAPSSLALGRVETTDQGATSLVSSGVVATNVDLKIVDPDRLEILSERRIGEIWLAGPPVASGYFRNPEATRKTFQAQVQGESSTYLRTGDLGFLDCGRLYVTGRVETRIIKYGRTYHSADLERAGRHAHDTLRPDRVAIFQDAEDGAIFAICEVRTQAEEDAARALWAAILRETRVAIDQVQLVAGSALLWTTSGKLRRKATARRIKSEPELLRMEWRPPAGDRALDQVGRVLSKTPLSSARLEEALCHWVAAQGGVDVSEIDPELPWADQYIDSLRASELVLLLEGVMSVPVDSDLLFEFACPSALAPQLVRMQT